MWSTSVYEREDIDRARRQVAIPAIAHLPVWSTARLERALGLFLWAALLAVVFAVGAVG